MTDAPAPSLTDALNFDKRRLRELSDSQFRALTAQVLQTMKEDRKENQILYYKPVSGIARDVWRCDTRYQCVGGGNRSGKTETLITKLVVLATGMFPFDLDTDTRAAMMKQFAGPINVRVVVESLTTTLAPSSYRN